MRARGFLAVWLLVGAVLALTSVTSASGEPKALQSAAGLVLAGGSGLGAEYDLSSPQGEGHHAITPAVAYNSQRDEYLVVWQRQTGTNTWEIDARRVNSRGAPVAATWQSVVEASVQVNEPAVAYNAANNEYLLVWSQKRADDDALSFSFEIRARRLAHDLVKVGADFPVWSWQQRQLWGPRVVWNSTHNEYLVAWNAYDTNSGQPSDVAVRRVGADGTPRGVALPFVWGTNPQEGNLPKNVDLTYNHTVDEYMLVWEQEYTAPPFVHDVYGVVLDGATAAVWNRDPFALTFTDEYGRKPRVTTNGHATFFVTWETYVAPYGQYQTLDIYGEELDIQGYPEGKRFVVSGWGGIDEYNEFVVAWPGQNRSEYLVGYQQEGTNSTDDYAAFYDEGRNAMDIGDYVVWLDAFTVATDASAPLGGVAGNMAGAMGRVGPLIAYEKPVAGFEHIFARVYAPYQARLPLVLR